MRKVEVPIRRVEDHSYDVLIGNNTLENLPECLRKRGLAGRLFVITDRVVNSAWGEKIKAELLKGGLLTEFVSIDPGEEHKNLETVEKIARELISRGANRESIVFALGGGVVGDISGFLASILMRGIPFVNVPTTLLAMVDSSVGGKTGVDLPEGKNLVGTFYQPKLVYIDIRFLSSLPSEEFTNGMAEVVKYGAILDADFFEFLETHAERILGGDEEIVVKMVARCCELKRNVVIQDEKESGLRRILNFGHTVGHALEALSGYTLKHGTAIAFGMMVAAQISTKRMRLPWADVERLKDLLEYFGLLTPVNLPLRTDDLLEKLTYDKKRYGKEIIWILLEQIGKARATRGTMDEELKEIIASWRRFFIS